MNNINGNIVKRAIALILMCCITVGGTFQTVQAKEAVRDGYTQIVEKIEEVKEEQKIKNSHRLIIKYKEGWEESETDSRNPQTYDLYSEGLAEENNELKHKDIKDMLSDDFDTEEFEVVKKNHKIGMEVLRIDEATSVDDVMEALTKNEDIEYVQPDYELYSLDSADNITDTKFNLQWALYPDDEIADLDIIEAWNTLDGSELMPIIGVLDTGIDIDHEELTGNIYVNTYEIAGNGIDDDGNGYIDDVNGYDFLNEDASVYDNNKSDEHGTNVAGIIAADKNNGDIIGIAPEATIIPLKFMEDGVGYTSDAIEAIEYAEMMGVEIINMSFGSDEYNQALYDAMFESDILFVTAAGNDGNELIGENRIYPACFNLDNAISVGAYNQYGELASFSNYGLNVDVLAPGEDVYTLAPGNKSVKESGTSFAAPFVAGLAALLKAKYGSLTTVELAERIKANSIITEIQDDSVSESSAYGLINATTILLGEDVFEEVYVPDETVEEINVDGDTLVEASSAIISDELLEQIHFGEEGVNVVTGNYSTKIIDLSFESPGFTINISRTYNSKDSRTPINFGYGWSFGFYGYIAQTDTRQYGVFLPDGSVQLFDYNKAEGTYAGKLNRSKLIKTDDYFILTTTDQYTYGFDASTYKMTWMEDRNGNRINITYLGSKIVSIADEYNREISISYDSSNKITSIEDPYGRAVAYEYDGKKLIKVISPDGSYISYDYASYDEKYLLMGFNDQDGAELEKIEYFSDKKVKRYVNAYGNETLYRYDTENKETTIKDTYKNVTTKLYDDDYNIILTIDPLGYETSSVYNDFAELVSATDRRGNTTSYTRDENGNIINIIYPDLSEEIYQYDGWNNLVDETDREGNITTYTFSSDGMNLIAENKTHTDGTTAAINYTYYDNGLLKTLTSAEGVITTYIYDNYGYLKNERDSDGNIIIYSYNNIGWLMEKTTAEGYKEVYEYDKVGNLLRITDGEGNVTRFVYDYNGHLIQKISGELYNEIYDSYDYEMNIDSYSQSVGLRYLVASNGLVEQVTDSIGSVTTYEYDVYGRLVEEFEPNGDTYKFTYDALGRETATLCDYKDDNYDGFKYLTSTEYVYNEDGTSQIIDKDYLSEAIEYTELSSEEGINESFIDIGDDFSVSSQGAIIQLVNGVLILGSYTGFNDKLNFYYSLDEGANWELLGYIETTTYGNYAPSLVAYSSSNKFSYLYYGYGSDDNRSTYVGTVNYELIEKFGGDLVDSGGMVADGLVSYRTHQTSIASYLNIDKNDRLCVSYTRHESDGDHEVYYSYSTDYGSSWTFSQVQDDNSRDYYSSGMAIDSNNSPFVYYRYGNYGYIYSVNNRSRDSLSKSKAYGLYKRPNGNLLVTFIRSVNENDEIFYKVFNSGATSWNEYQFTNSGVLDINGTPFVPRYSQNGKDEFILFKEKLSTGNYALYGYNISDVSSPVIEIEDVDANYGLCNYYSGLDTPPIVLDKADGLYYYGSFEKETETTYPNFLDSSLTEDEKYAITTKTYDVMNRLVCESNSLGNETTMTYTDNGQVETITYPDGGEKQYAYDYLGNVTDIWTRYIGTTYYAYQGYQYNKDGQKIMDIVGRNYVELGTKPTTVYTKVTEYNSLGQKEHEYEGNGNISNYDYKSGSYQAYAYDSDGRIITSVTTMNSSLLDTDADKFRTKSFTYDCNDNLISTTEYVQSKDLYGYSDTSTMIGLVTTSEYNKDGNIIKTISADGTVTEYSYYDDGSLKSLSTAQVNENGKNVIIINEYLYDELGRIINVKKYEGSISSSNQVGNSITYIYDEYGNLAVEMITYNDGNGKKIDSICAYGYDFSGRLIVEVKPENYKVHTNSSLTWVEHLKTLTRTEFVYDSEGNLISEADYYTDEGEKAAVITRSYTYDSMGRLLTSTDGEGNVISNTYYYNGALRATQSQEAKERKLAYDKYYSYRATGELYAEFGPEHKNGSYLLYFYDQDGNRVLTRYMDSNGLSVDISRKTYNDLGEVVTSKDGNGNKTTYNYNNLGQLRSVVLPSDDSIGTLITDYEYNLNGQVVYEGDSDDSSTLYNYYDNGLTKSVIINSSDSPETLSTGYSYDILGNLATLNDQGGISTSYSYDGLGKVVSETKENHEVVYEYDRGGRIISTATTVTTDDGTEVSSVTANEYDGLGRLVRQYDANGELISEKTYDDNHQQITETDGRGYSITYTYDSNGREVETQDREGGITSNHYDDLGCLIEVEDQNGNSTEYAYDGRNRLISVTNALGETTSYTYDNNDNLITQTTDDGRITYYEYNVRNLVVQFIDYGGRTGTSSYTYDEDKLESYTYNVDGTLETKTDRNGITTVYTYDGFNRLISEVAGGDSREYAYDDLSNIVTIEDETGTTSKTYDAFGRVTTKDVPNVGTFIFSYDETDGNGHIKYVTEDPDGNISYETYDENGRIYQVFDGNEGELETYTYDENGNKDSISRAGVLVTDYTYDKENRLTKLVNYDDGSVISQYNYTYDDVGNQLSKISTVDGESDTVTYTYDTVNRLKYLYENDGTKVTQYNYDGSGNREWENVTDGNDSTNSYMTEYIYDDQNRLVTTIKEQGDVKTTTTYNYDNNGNLIAKINEVISESSDEETSISITLVGEESEDVSYYIAYSYDNFNQLVKAVSGSEISSYKYNGEGYRTVTTVDGVVTYQAYKGSKVIFEVSDSEITRSIYGGKKLILRDLTDVDQEYYYYYNGHGDVTALQDFQTGEVVAEYDYDPFGNIINQTGDEVDNPILYAGYQYDEETGLYYLNARMYDPEIARFMQMDTYRGTSNDPLSLNLYSYTHNNPIRYYDPTGHWIESDSKLSQSDQEEIIRLTTAYYDETDDITKEEAHELAEAIRARYDNSGAQQLYDEGDSSFGEAFSEVLKSGGRGYLSASEWQGLVRTNYTNNTVKPSDEFSGSYSAIPVEGTSQDEYNQVVLPYIPIDDLGSLLGLSSEEIASMKTEPMGIGDLVDAIYFEVGIGFGVKKETSIWGQEAEVGVKGDVINIRLENGEFKFGTQMDYGASFDIYDDVLDGGYDHDAFREYQYNNPPAGGNAFWYNIFGDSNSEIERSFGFTIKREDTDFGRFEMSNKSTDYLLPIVSEDDYFFAGFNVNVSLNANETAGIFLKTAQAYNSFAEEFNGR